MKLTNQERNEPYSLQDFCTEVIAVSRNQLQLLLLVAAHRYYQSAAVF